MLALGVAAASCRDAHATQPVSEQTSTERAVGNQAAPLFDCPDTPTAYVLELESGSAADALRDAGFDVEPLPRDESPFDLRGLIAIGSDAASDPAYAQYMERYAEDLFGFVDQANVLVQLPQSPQDEAAPPFLPTTHSARRGAAVSDELFVLNPVHPLLFGAPARDERGSWQGETLARGVYEAQGGFEVVVAADEDGGGPTLLEGAYGQGRILLSAIPLDDPAPQPPLDELAPLMLTNLRDHVSAVCQRAAEAVDVTPSAADFFTEGSFMLAVLPDTQVYSLRFPGLFLTQTAWLAQNARTLGIGYVLHLGDIVNNNTDLEWERAAAAMSLLDGRVPYALVPGNHDYGPSGDASTRDSGLNTYFSFDAAALMSTFGGAYEAGKLDNTYHLLSGGGRDFILIALEWGPRDEVLQWADDVMHEHPDRDGILITHAYLNNNDRRYDHADTEHPQRFNPHQYATPGGVNDGEEIWQKLVRHHRFVITLNGHVLGDGTGYLVSETDMGNRCHQILANYQMRNMGGEAYMRLLEFLPDGREVRVHSYSPLYDALLQDADQSFSFEL